jgi:hypothetical protein
VFFRRLTSGAITIDFEEKFKCTLDIGECRHNAYTGWMTKSAPPLDTLPE